MQKLSTRDSTLSAVKSFDTANSKIKSNLEEFEITSSVRTRYAYVADVGLVSIESSGILPPEDLFLKSVSLLRAKCQRLKSEIDANRHAL
jgi:hypothetical protein